MLFRRMRYLYRAFRASRQKKKYMGMNHNELLEKALAIALKAHAGQTDKAGAAYVLHPIRVAGRCATDEERMTALLHDTIEDADVTADELLAEGFPPATVDAVVALTRKEEETYEDYVGRCSLNPLARRVKLHDLEDNMDISRLSRVTEKDLERLDRYVRAYSFLKA